jgi:phosphate transport system substrate-binding protein
MLDEVNEFMQLYRQNGAEISYTITSSESAVYHFIYDTARIAFFTRALNQTEKEIVKKTSADLNEIIIAYDGIAVAVHSKNSIEQMTTTEIQKIIEGAITRWEQLSYAKQMRGIIKIYCQDSTDITEYLTRRFMLRAGISAKFTRTKSDLSTLLSVEKDPRSLGFVALSWIDSAKSPAKVLNLGRTKEDTDTSFVSPAESIGKFFSPHPVYIFRGDYPLKRAIYMYTRTQVDLAAGFGTFIATAEGQKIILKRGILPGTQRIKLKSDQS